jgi:transposase InsO family protein
MGIKQVLSAPRSPWQRAYVERVIGTIRRECLDHRIVFGEGSLYRHLQNFINYHHRSRTHLVLAKDRANGWAVFGSAACKLFYKREFYKRECQEKLHDRRAWPPPLLKMTLAGLLFPVI